MTRDEKKALPVRVVEVDPKAKPLPATVVENKSVTTTQKISVLGVVLLLLFFVASGYIQSAKNGEALRQAEEERRQVVTSLSEVTRALDVQSKLTQQLQDAVREQNEALKAAGISPVVVPGETPSTAEPSLPSQPNPEQESPVLADPPTRPQPEPGPTRTAQPEPRPTPVPRPSSRPSSNPEPSPTPAPEPTRPLGPVQDTICSLIGICT